MESSLAERMTAVVEQMLLDMRRKWWWWLVAPVGALLYWKFQGWIADVFWRFLTAHINLARLQSFVGSDSIGHGVRPIIVLVGFFLLVVLGFFVHAYFETRTVNRAITGAADLLVTRMDMGDAIHVDANWEDYSADLGFFCRMSITANGKSRTVKKFIMEVRAVRDGIPQEPTLHVADSERAIGNFLYRYKQQATNHLGFAVINDVYEEMPDLAARLRTPLEPETHAEGWARFELENVSWQIERYHITVYAVDANDRKHKIDTASMRIPNPLQEYVLARPL